MQTSRITPSFIHLLIAIIQINAIISQSCTYQFPKVFGGDIGGTYFNDIDAHALTNQIVVAGHSSDHLLIDDTAGTISQRPIMALYRGANFELIWKKYFSFNSAKLSAVVFDPSGKYIASHFSISKIMVLRALDGGVIWSRSYPSPASKTYNQGSRNIVFTNEAPPSILVQLLVGTNPGYQGYQLIKIGWQFSDQATWALQSRQIQAQDRPYGLRFVGSSPARVLSLGKQNAQPVLSCINNLNGALIWDYYWLSSYSSNYFLQNYEGAGNYAVFAVAGSTSGQSYLRVIMASDGSYVSDLQFIDPTSNIQSYKGMFVQDINNLITLVFGIYGGKNNVVMYQQVSFASMVALTKPAFPQLSVDSIGITNAVFLSSNIYLIAFSSAFVIKDETAPLIYQLGPSVYRKAIIFLNTPSTTCLAFSTGSSSLTVTNSGSVVLSPAPGAPQLIPVTVSLIDMPVPYSKVNDITAAAIPDISSWCSATTPYYVFSVTPNIPSGTIIKYTLTSQTLHTIYPPVIQATPYCGASALTITYQAMMQDGSNPISTLDFSQFISSNYFQVLPATPLGKFTLVLASIASNSQQYVFIYEITIANGKPTFSEYPQDISTYKSKPIVYTIAPINDPENDPITLSVVEIGQTTLPYFISFDRPSQNLYINPDQNTIAKEYYLIVTITDGYTEDQVEMKVIILNDMLKQLLDRIMNIGPPTFIIPLQAQEVQVYSTITYMLPAINDPDKDNFIITIEYGNAGSFSTFNSKQGLFTFSPLPQNVKSTEYKIKIELLDQNPHYQKSSTSFLKVTVIPGNETVINQQLNTTNISATNIQIRQAIALGAEIRNASIRITRISQTGKATIRIQAEYLAYKVVKAINESDLNITIVQNQEETIPFKIINRDESASTLKIQLYFKNPEAISNTNVSIQQKSESTFRHQISWMFRL